MSAVATDRFHGSTAATEILVLEPVAQRLGLAPILLEPGEITIGSSPDCQVQLTAAGVQDHHCVLVCAGSRVSLRALDRRTWHNNLPISGGWLRVGDRLAIGPVEFRVRQAESGEIASANSSSVDSPGAADVPVTARQKQFEQGRVKVFESQLLQEIAGLEAEVARHQSAVNRLEQQAAPVADPAVPADLGSASVSRPTSGKLEPTARPEFSSPQFHLRAATTGSGEVQPGALLDDVETQSRQARRQLAELAVREAAVQRQGLELETQWDQLRELIAEQDAATAERSEREQQLQEREQRCAFQETEIARRSQGLSEQLENATARLQQLQTETDQLGQQSAQLTEREKSLADFSHQLNAREAELEQIRIALVEQEATHRDAAEAGQSWQQLRDATESRWALRAQELDTQVSLQQSQADALVRREQACEQLEAEVRHDRQQLLADQTHLGGWNQELTQLQATLDGHLQEHEARQGTWQSREAELQSREAAYEQTAAAVQQEREHVAAEQIRLQTWNDELTQSQSVFTHQQQELAVEAATIKAEAQEFVLREYAWEQIVSSTQRDRERLEADREQLEALRLELHTKQSELTERQLQLESQESNRKTQMDDFVQREHGLEQAIADLQQDEDRLVAEEQRLTAWDAQLSARQSQLDAQQQDLTARTTHLTEQTADLSQREQAWEQTSTNATEVQGELLAERNRLEAWLAELSALHAALTTDRQELEAQQADWTETRRSESESVSTALTNEYASLAQLREELARTEHQLEQADADLSDLEVELWARDEELRAREHALHQAEIECAWQQRESELHLGNLVPATLEDAVATDADVSEKLSDERDLLAQELFLATQSAETTALQTDQLLDQFRQQTEQLAREVEACQQQLDAFDAEHETLAASNQEFQDLGRAWQAERQSLQAARDTHESQLATERESLQQELAALQSREAELAGKWEELKSAQSSLDQAAQEVRQQQAELAQQTQTAEQQRHELAEQLAQQSVAAESFLTEKSATNRDLADQRDALSDEQTRLDAARAELDRQRAAWEQDRQAWREQLDAERESLQPDSSRTDIWSSLSRLDDLVQTELDHDTPTDEGAGFVDAFEALPSEFAESTSETDQTDLDDVSEHSLHETPHSLWSADPQDADVATSVSTSDLPTTDEDLSVLSLRARLAEMFSLELSASDTDAAAETPATGSADESNLDDSLQTESIESESFDSPGASSLERSEPSVSDFSAEPVADEYDSVESYMQRLLDRNRRSRAGEEAVPERPVVAASKSPVMPHIVLPVVPQPLSEFDDSVSPPAPEAELTPESESIVRVRGPVDTLKMRAGLDSLRQMANISARHAIARSKWKKLRTRIALQSLLTAASGVIGLSILTGKHLGFVDTNLWGWLALVIMVTLGCKVILDIRWIYQGDRRASRAADSRTSVVAANRRETAESQDEDTSTEDLSGIQKSADPEC